MEQYGRRLRGRSSDADSTTCTSENWQYSKVPESTTVRTLSFTVVVKDSSAFVKKKTFLCEVPTVTRSVNSTCSFLVQTRDSTQ